MKLITSRSILVNGTHCTEGKPVPASAEMTDKQRDELVVSGALVEVDSDEGKAAASNADDTEAAAKDAAAKKDEK